MTHPLGWDLPAGAANDPRAPWNDPGHHPRCPQHEDNLVDGSDEEPECTCQDLDEEDHHDKEER